MTFQIIHIPTFVNAKTKKALAHLHRDHKKILLIREELIPWVSILVPNYYFAYATSELMNPQVKIDAHQNQG